MLNASFGFCICIRCLACFTSMAHCCSAGESVTSPVVVGDICAVTAPLGEACAMKEPIVVRGAVVAANAVETFPFCCADNEPDVTGGNWPLCRLVSYSVRLCC